MILAMATLPREEEDDEAGPTGVQLATFLFNQVSASCKEKVVDVLTQLRSLQFCAARGHDGGTSSETSLGELLGLCMEDFQDDESMLTLIAETASHLACAGDKASVLFERVQPSSYVDDEEVLRPGHGRDVEPSSGPHVPSPRSRTRTSLRGSADGTRQASPPTGTSETPVTTVATHTHTYTRTHTQINISLTSHRT